MLTFLNKYANNLRYSQNGEEGILIECIKRIDASELTIQACEFGAHNGKYCSNTRYLVDVLGYNCIMIEHDRDLFNKLFNDSRGDSISCINSMVIPNNINQLLKPLDNNFDVLSIDTDGDNDYDCFRALEKKPKIVIVEINSGFKPDVIDRKDAYSMMVYLGISKGYFLLCHTGNLVFVDNKYRELFSEVTGNGISNANEYFNKSWL